jgi:hypothetical protein
MTLYRICYYPISNMNNVNYGNYVLDHITAKAWILELNKKYPYLHHSYEIEHKTE